MIPVYFKEANKDLLKPKDMTDDECGSLPVYADGRECISKWSLSLFERLHCLFFGFIWVRVLTNSKTQPPVALTAERTVFEKEKSK